MSTSTISPIIMNLTGQYATDFQNILNKAVQTSSVPLSILQAKDTAVLAHKTALGSLASTVNDFSDSLASLGSLANGQALGATSSNSAAVTVSNSGATVAASYTINSVTSAATTASETSLISYAAATNVSASGGMELMVGTKKFDFTLTNNDLQGLADKINGLSGAGVTASILTTAGGNYLSLQATSTGAAAIQLHADPAGANTNMMSSTNPGTNAVFSLNGISINQASNTVNNVIPGMTFKIVAATTAPVTLSLASDSTQLTSRLSDMVTKYNAVVSAVNAQSGRLAGALSGDTVIQQLRTALARFTSYTNGSSGIKSLADLGVTFNTANGAATFDPSVVGAMSTTQVTAALKYAAASTTGLGGFSKTFGQLSDPISGVIQIEIAGDNSSDSHLQDQISTTTARINSMQAALAKQIEAADALESAYESQQTTLKASLQGLNLVLYGKSLGSV